jgi:hypothetical protein
MTTRFRNTAKRRQTSDALLYGRESLAMKTYLLGATVLIGLAAPAWATSLNNIRIDAVSNGGAAKTLQITQDDVNLNNQVSGNSAGTTSFAAAGTWHSVNINQQGGNNKLYGSIKAGGASSTSSLTASYTGGNNTHSLTIGGTTAPVNPTVAITVNNTGAETNTITDTLDGTSLSYNLALTGTGNTLTNAVAATGAIALNQGGGSYGVTGNDNTISNTVSGVASFTHNLTLTGNSNSITNAASGGGDKTITESIASDNNTVSVSLTGSGTQSAALTSDSGSKLDFILTAAAANSAANIILSNVSGAASAPAVIRVTQTALADGATANLSVSGGTYTMGTTLTGGAGAIVTQNSPGAYLNASVAAAANGYTVNITQ